MAKIKCYELHLGNESPRLGTGRRFVFAKVGYKKVKVCSTSMDTVNMSRRAFDHAVIREIELNDASRKHMHRAAIEHMKFKTPTQFTKGVMEMIGGAA